jgi:predicted porin
MRPTELLLNGASMAHEPLRRMQVDMGLRRTAALKNGMMIALLTLITLSAHAQIVLSEAPVKLNLEGYANATVGHGERESGTSLGDARSTQVDAGIRLYAEHSLGAQRVIGVRVEVNTSPEDHINVGERSLIYIDTLGRFELGRRRGLPDSLIGYAPNTYAFTSAEFGVTSGRTLDPGANLATSFLQQGIAQRINAVSENGANAAFFGDTSPKILYVSPKVLGTQLGLSFSPKLENGDRFTNPYRELLQTGLAYQEDFGQNFFRVGGSFSYAHLDHDLLRENVIQAGELPNQDLNSLSIGAALNLGEVWEFGLNLSQNNRGDNSPSSARHGAHGITASINYNEGKWVYGGYVQRANGGSSSAGKDVLTVFQLGMAYRIDTKLRVYVAYYTYQLNHEGVDFTNIAPSNRGNVLLAGLRWTL